MKKHKHLTKVHYFNPQAIRVKYGPKWFYGKIIGSGATESDCETLLNNNCPSTPKKGSPEDAEGTEEAPQDHELEKPEKEETVSREIILPSDTNPMEDENNYSEMVATNSVEDNPAHKDNLEFSENQEDTPGPDCDQGRILI